ncbi:MAG: hypothetical protein JWO35_764 [Candidatus Saccharibacteria bacterium]|nr:hypothetical protein [Candidatus Saccharibacteria bacterium]
MSLEELPSGEPPEPTITDTEPTKPSRRRVKLYVAGAVAALSVIAVGWLLSSVYLSKIMVAGVAIPARSSDTSLASTLNTRATTYRLAVAYPNGTKKQYPLSQLGFTLDKNASVQATRHQQHKFAQRLKWWQPVPASVVMKTNKAALNNFIATEANVTVQPSRDAVLSIEKGEIRITDAVAGKQYGLAQPQKTILASAHSLKSGTIKLKTLTVNPALTASLLEPYKARLDKTINQPISFTVGDKTITPSPADIASWLEITPDDKSKKVDITVNSGKVQEYINDAAAAYVYPAKAQIETKQTDGTTRVLVAGVDGADVTNKSDAAATVAKTLLDGKGIGLPLSVSYESFQTITTGSYDKWIEVDLTHKRMYAYEKDNLVKTELVTAGAPSTPTVTGQYAIYAKYDQQDMRGNNVDGSRYFQPNVRWINYFYKDYAVHGNYWRPLSYFGNVNSSHGCVSLVDSEAEWMYSWAPIGTPVVVHK